jgi:hypothetical protein
MSCYNLIEFTGKEGHLVRRKSRLFDLFFNARSASLGIPLLIATVFSFGYILWHQDSSSTPASTNPSKLHEEEQRALPDIPISEQSHLPSIEASDSSEGSQAPLTSSPQTGATPNYSVHDNAGGNSSTNSSANRTTKGNGEVKLVVPLLP